MGIGQNKASADELDFLQDIGASNLLERIRALGEVEIVSIYPVGAIHYAWIRKPKRVEPANIQKPSGKERK